MRLPLWIVPPSKQNSRKHNPSHRLRFEPLEDRTVPTGGPFDIQSVIDAYNTATFHVNQVQQVNEITTAFNSAFGANLPLIQESFADVLSAVDDLLDPFSFALPTTGLSDFTQLAAWFQGISGNDFTVEYANATPEAGTNDILRLRWTRTIDASPFDFTMGGSAGFSYLADDVDGFLDGDLTTNFGSATIDIVFGIDDAAGTPTFFVREGGGLTFSGVGASGEISGNLGIGYLLNVNATATLTASASGSLLFQDSDADGKLRTGVDLTGAAIASAFETTFSGDVTINGQFTSDLPVLGDLTWGVDLVAPIVDGTITLNAPTFTLPQIDFLNWASDAANSAIGDFDIFGGSSGVFSNGSILPSIGISGIGSLGDLLGLTSLFGGLGFQVDSVDVTPDNILRLIKGERVDLLELSVGNSWQRSESIGIPLAAIPFAIGPIPVAVRLTGVLGVNGGYSYYAAIGVDTLGVYIDPLTHLRAWGGAFAGLQGSLDALGFLSVAAIEAGVGVRVHAGIGLGGDPDKSDGRIYLDEIFNNRGSIADGILGLTEVAIGGDAYGYAKAEINLPWPLPDITLFDQQWIIAGFGTDVGTSNQNAATPAFGQKDRTRDLPSDAPLADPLNGVLTLDGSSRASRNSINVRSVDGGIEVSWRGVGKSVYSTQSLARINFTGNHLADWLNVEEGLSIEVYAVGNDGDDYLTGGDAGATIFGGDGHDRIYGGSANDSLEGGSGNDLIRGNGGNDIIQGNDGADELIGDAGEDVIDGGTGSDLIDGGIDNDQLFGNDGDDFIVAGSGNDVVDGGAGKDQIFGESGNDLLTGGTENDTILGGDGNDTILGGDGDDVLGGENDNDEIHGEAGDDTLFGGGGNDLLVGDYLTGNVSTDSGNDVLYGDGQANTLLDGNDTIYGGGFVQESEIVSYSNAPNESGDGADSAFGGGGNDFIYGGRGADQLNGNLGTDSIYGGPGDDRLLLDFNGVDASPSDHLDGGLNHDTLAIVGKTVLVEPGGTDAPYLSDEFDDFIELAQTAPNTFIVVSRASENGPITDSFTFYLDGTPNGNVERLGISGLGGNDLIKALPGVEKNLLIEGGAGNDTLIGGDGRDSIVGGEGNDVIDGGDGDDVLEGGTGRDSIDGNAGSDVLYGGDETPVQGEADDTLNGGESRDVVYAGNGNDIVHAGPGFEGDLIFGQAGNDTLYGGDGIDVILGGTGDDWIDGRNGRNVIFGESGNDVIFAGTNQLPLQDWDDEYDLLDDRRDEVRQLQLDLDDALIEVSTQIEYDLNRAEYAKLGADLGMIDFAALTINPFQTVLVNVIDGGQDNDAIYGTPFNDQLVGSDGNDTIFHSAGNDTITGGTGDNDIYAFEGTEQDDTINAFLTDAGGGNLQATVNGAPNGLKQIDVETIGVYGRGGNDTLIVDFGNQATFKVYIDGGDGDDFIDAGSVFTQQQVVNFRTAFPLQAQATLLGGDGNDTITGGLSDDFIDGGGDDDVLSGESASALIGGNDTILGQDGNDLIHGRFGNDSIEGGNHADTIYAGDGNDTVYGGNGEDYLDGGDGIDALFGGAENDTLVGGDGNDRLDGQDGDDELHGMAGDDQLVLSNGSDEYHGWGGLDDIVYVTSEGGSVIVYANSILHRDANNAVIQEVSLGSRTSIERVDISASVTVSAFRGTDEEALTRGVYQGTLSIDSITATTVSNWGWDFTRDFRDPSTNPTQDIPGWNYLWARTNHPTEEYRFMVANTTWGWAAAELPSGGTTPTHFWNTGTHPRGQQVAIVGWKSPFSGTIAIRGALTDNDTQGGDGFELRLEHGYADFPGGPTDRHYIDTGGIGPPPVDDPIAEWTFDPPMTQTTGSVFQWLVEDGGNGHWYEYVAFADGERRWDTARELAYQRQHQEMRGHLASITSAAEDAFIYNMFVSQGGVQPWIGGIQYDHDDPYYEPEVAWHWITGEPFSYANWDTGEPNNLGQEDYLHFHGNSSWNDINYTAQLDGFIVEYEGPPNAGTIQYVNADEWIYLVIDPRGNDLFDDTIISFQIDFVDDEPTSVEPPVLLPSSPLELHTPEGQPFALTLQAYSDSGNLQFELLNGPAGASVDAASGLLTWNPADGTGDLTSFYVRVLDLDTGLSDEATFNVEVANANPLAGVSGQNGVRGESLSVALTATDPSPIDQAAGFTFHIDWNGDGSFDQTVTGPSGTVVEHVFPDSGDFTVRVQATDKDGGTSLTAEQVVSVSDWELREDPADPELMDLVWGGTSGADAVAFERIDAETVRFTITTLNGAVVSQTMDVQGVNGKIVAYAGAGNDTLIGSTGGDYLDGGADADTIYGDVIAPPKGAIYGPDTVIGGEGNDTIYGDGDGGEGAPDLIYGGAGDDVIFGDGAEGDRTGNDTIHGGTGNDTIHGEPDGAEGAADSIFGEDGDDFINAGGGHDYVDGGSGNDILLGGDGAEGANDTLIGGEGRDILVADGGASFLTPLAGGIDSLDGGAGQDIIVAGLVLQTELNPVDFFAIRDEWTSSRSFTQRILNITGPGSSNRANGDSYFNPGTTVYNDKPANGGTALVDEVFGGSEEDWILADNQEDNTADFDALEDLLVDIAGFPRPE